MSRSGRKKSNEPLRFNDEAIQILSALTNRAQIASRLGQSYSGDRNLYEALGYKLKPEFADYLGRYTRQDIAKAVINKPVNASWRVPPRITESEKDATKFEDVWNALVKDNSIYRQIVRADKLAGIGNYSTLLIGLDDGKSLEEEIGSAKKLLFLQPYSQKNAVPKTFVIDSGNARFGLPLTYQIDVKTGVNSTGQKVVHHSRIIHIAEELLEDNTDGMPRLECVLNRLEDLERVVGGSAEMFWRGAFQGFGLKNDIGSNMKPQALANVQEEMDKFLHGMQRYIRLQNMSIEEIAPQVSDPSSHVNVILDLIAAATGIPKRILLGSERGELASTQDEKNWFAEIDSRRKNYCEPSILRPLIDKLITHSVLPEPADGYAIEWPDLMAPSAKEVADIGAVRAKAIKDYTSSVGADMLVPPDMFLRKGLGFTDDEVGAANEQLKDMNDALNKGVDDGDE